METENKKINIYSILSIILSFIFVLVTLTTVQSTGSIFVSLFFAIIVIISIVDLIRKKQGITFSFVAVCVITGLYLITYVANYIKFGN